MRPSRRFAPLVLGLLAGLTIAACGDTASRAPSEPATEEIVPAHLSGIADPEILELIAEIFPPGNDVLANAFAHYSQIRVKALTGDLPGAVVDAFEFLRWTLRLLERGRLVPPKPANAVAHLFELIFAELGVDGPPLSGMNLGDDFAIGLIGPAGGKVTVPSHHAAIAFDPGMLSGPTWVAVSGLPDPSDPGMCPFGFPVDVDCYPLFYDYSLFPESNLTGVPRIGQCVVEEGPLAPPSESVEMRLRIASESEDHPGTLVFWPLSDPPTTIDCSDLEGPQVAAWQGALFEALGPLAGLFRVTPAWANPGRLGASISSFSPFAPADPESDHGEEPPPPPEEEIEGTIEGQVLNSFEQPVAGQVVELRRAGGGYTDSTVTGQDGGFEFAGLPIDPEGTDYQVRAATPQGSDSERVTLTEEDPDAFVTLMVPAGGDVIEF